MGFVRGIEHSEHFGVFLDYRHLVFVENVNCVEEGFAAFLVDRSVADYAFSVVGVQHIQGVF
jgi:hypothetical protein